MNAQNRFGDIKRLVLEAVSQETGIPRQGLDENEPFETFGIESVLSVAIVRRLEESLGELSKTLLFEFQTIRALVDHLAGERIPSMPILAARGDPSSADAFRSPSPLAPAVDTRSFDGIDALAPGHAPLDARSARQDRAVEPIAIIGLSGRFPLARDLDEYWRNLAAGRDCITEIPERLWNWRDYWHPDKGVPGKSYSKWGGFLEDSDRFDPLFFNISNLQAASMDPQERVFLETVHHLLEDAGYTREGLRGSRVGLYVAAMWGSYQHHGVDESATDSSFSSIANRASYFFGLTGPSMALDTTCSGSLTTLHLACESIRSGESDLAIAGGVNITSHPQKYLVLSRTGFASPDGRCHSFGADAGGYVPGDGSGAVLLKPLSAAIADGDRINAVIRSTAINHGGRSSGFTVPSADAQAELIATALDRAGVDARTISYVEAHAPGTPLGDPIEVRGMTSAFRKQTDACGFCPVGSVKSNVGHLEAAAGIASIAKVVLQLRHRQIAPSIHAERLNPNIDFDPTPFYVNRALAPWPAPTFERQGRTVSAPRRAGISGFGAGGSNAHAIVEEYVAPVARTTPASEQLIILSAKTEERLREIVRRLRDSLVPGVAPTGPIGAPVHAGSVEDRVLACVSDVTSVRAALLDDSDRLADLLTGEEPFDALARALNDAFDAVIDRSTLAALTIADLTARMSLAGADLPAGGGSDAAHLERIAYTLQIGREAMEHRFATLVRSTAELIERLDAFVAGDPPAQTWTGRAPAVPTVASDEELHHVARLATERHYERLARVWIEGMPVPWSALYPVRPDRIALPLYPFAPEVCWVQPRVGVPTTPAARDVSFVPDDETAFIAAQRLCYRPAWSALGATRGASAGTSRGRGIVLVYPAAAAALAEALKPMLPAADPWEIVLGTRTELLGRRKWEVDADQDVIATCLSFVEDLGTIYFLGEGAAIGPAATRKGEAQGTLALFHLAQWLGTQDATSAIRLRVITNRGCAVARDDHVQPQAAAILGFARSLTREHPAVECDLIDLALNIDEIQASAAARADLQLAVAGIEGVREVAIRHARGHVRTLMPYDPARPVRPVFRRGGTYVLVGGAGTVGSQLSRSLAERAQAHVVWLGRRSATPEIADQAAHIAELGGTLDYHSVDAGDTAALTAVIDEIERKHGRIDGVLHLAKVHEITRIRDLELDALKRILHAKTATSVALEAALDGRDIGFVALYSSSEAHVGSVGWSGYAAACSFQDAFALEWARRVAYPVIAVNWGYWEGVSEDVAAMLATKGVRPLAIDTGLAILEAALADRVSQLAALDVDPAVLDRMGFAPRPASGGEAVTPSTALEPVTVAGPTPPPATASRAGERLKFDFRTFDPATFDPEMFDPASFPGPDELPSHERVADAVTELISDVLRIDRDRIERGADLITYGIDSLTVIALHKTLEGRTGTLPATLFITAHSVDAVAAELLDRYPVAAYALAGGGTAATPAEPTAQPEPIAPLRVAGSMRRLGAVGADGVRAYLDGYGARFHDHSLAEDAARAEPQLLKPKLLRGRGLDHLLVDTATAPGVEVLSAGKGVPVLLLPAVGLTAPTWRHQLASPLTERMRLSVAHLPGYGLTGPIGDSSSAGLTRTVAELVDQLVPDRPIHIVASCLGCVAGMNFARLFPERVASLTLVGGFHDTSDMNVADPAKLTTDELTALLNGAVDRIRDDFAAVTPPDPTETPQQQLDWLLNGLCANALVALRYLTEMLTLPVLDWLPEIRVPTQCIYGTADVIVGTHHSHTIAAAIDGAQLIAVEGAGHFPYLTHHDEFNPLIEQFVFQHEPVQRRDAPRAARAAKGKRGQMPANAV